MHPAGIEPTISAGKRPQNYSFDRAATETGFFTRTGNLLMYILLVSHLDLEQILMAGKRQTSNRQKEQFL